MCKVIIKIINATTFLFSYRICVFVKACMRSKTEQTAELQKEWLYKCNCNS